MPIVQFYKSQISVASALWPVAPGGATLNWPLNLDVPSLAGNYWAINYIEGFQAPSVDVSVPLLDGSSGDNLPILPATLNALFLTRTSNYQHDITKVGGTGIKFFDGFSGFEFPDAKGNSFSISGAKGDSVRFGCNFMAYASAGAIPTVTTTAPNNTYPYFQGAPIRFQSLKFQVDTGAGYADLDGVVSFGINVSNNMSPDMSMVGATPQSVFPIDCNAGMLTVSAQFVFQANSSSHLTSGSKIRVHVIQNSLTTVFTLNNILVNDGLKSRSVGTGRQLRPYTLICGGASNALAPIVVT